MFNLVKNQTLFVKALFGCQAALLFEEEIRNNTILVTVDPFQFHGFEDVCETDTQLISFITVY